MVKQFTRTFHPIGQGAFYTEKIVTDIKDYNVIYDCGSSTLKGNKLKKYVNNSFYENEEIDLLFISHFHADHINGLDFLKTRCKIKKVVMPLLDDIAKILARISLMLDGENTAIIDNPSSYFGNDTEIIEVNPISEYRQEGKEYTLETLFDIDVINSGAKIVIDTDWYYIPYNYEMTTRNGQFISELNKVGLSIYDVNTIDKIISNKEKIIQAYEKVDSRLNPLSLILFSGNTYTRLKTYYSRYYYRYFKSNNSGCLYLGDIDLNQVKIVEDIKSRLNFYWGNISIIQIPHHGSIDNYKDSILSPSIKFAVLSYGTTNTYGHPSSLVRASLLLSNVYPFHITEIQESIVIQFKR